MQILIADSDNLLIKRCRGYFGNRGYQVTVAGDGLECLDALRRVPPDILVLEKELPWGGGEGVLAYIREDHFRWPGAVIVTSSEPAAPHSESMLPPVVAVLPKPFSLAALFETIRRAQYGDSHLAARFLERTRQLEVNEQRRMPPHADIGPRPSRFGGLR